MVWNRGTIKNLEGEIENFLELNILKFDKTIDYYKLKQNNEISINTEIYFTAPKVPKYIFLCRISTFLNPAFFIRYT
ncbi:hypothetical protein ATZ36_07310 [Candidatus Endomicrobiellum trichonymphae]|uniref:Uncharacterized protein n=1 Tax=Endomicrobium trichonymphae TaxID=1408204 RepID=A0A1E5IHA8_ENDTX|nr:hypothetical protein ATZ36_07310 [Candidatus Endomicrobium trichonymphae]